jgi:hypothetical protein
MTMVNWAAWEHQEIREMLDRTVNLGNIANGVQAWREQGQATLDVLSRLTGDLNKVVSGGWRGAAADRALTALDPINQWLVSQADTTEFSTALMDAAGFCAGQAKAMVPPPKPFDMGEALRSFANGGMVGLRDDVVAQEQQRVEAHAEAVRIMTTVYSAPINDYAAAVPAYPQLVDPTLQPPEQPPNPGPAPGYPGGGVGTPGGGHVTHPQPVPAARPPSVPAAHPPSAPTAHPQPVPVAGPQPTPVALQNVTSGVSASYGGGPAALDQGTSQVGGQAALAAAAGVPVIGQLVGDAWQARAAGGLRLGGGGAGGLSPGGVRLDGGHPAEFGPRPSTVTEQNHLAGGATSMGAGRAANPGAMMAPMGAGPGRGGEDSEHQRPSYLIEMDDVFTDGRKVAPAVIGEDPLDRDG